MKTPENPEVTAFMNEPRHTLRLSDAEVMALSVMVDAGLPEALRTDTPPPLPMLLKMVALQQRLDALYAEGRKRLDELQRKEDAATA